MSYEDRVRETSISTGTGALTLAGAFDVSFRTFNAAHGTGVAFKCLILNTSTGEWEVGNHQLSGVATLARVAGDVDNGSNGVGVLVNFGSGTRVIVEVISAKSINDIITALSGKMSSSATTDSVTEGSANLYFTAARVRAAILTGISFATGTDIDATDTVLSAFGKIQKKFTDLLALKNVWIKNQFTKKVTLTASATPTPDAQNAYQTYAPAQTWTLQIPSNLPASDETCIFELYITQGATPYEWSLATGYNMFDGETVPSIAVANAEYIARFCVHSSTNIEVSVRKKN